MTDKIAHGATGPDFPEPGKLVTAPRHNPFPKRRESDTGKGFPMTAQNRDIRARLCIQNAGFATSPGDRKIPAIGGIGTVKDIIRPDRQADQELTVMSIPDLRASILTHGDDLLAVWRKG